MLEAEMDEHLGYEKNSVKGNNSGNSRNGYGKKTIISDYGECEIAVPRDRNGEFEPLLERGSGSKPEQGEKFKYYVVVEMLTENNGGYSFTYNYDFYGFNYIDLTFEICNTLSDGQKGE